MSKQFDHIKAVIDNLGAKIIADINAGHEVALTEIKESRLSEAFKDVAQKHKVEESTVRDACTRKLGMTTEEFANLIMSSIENVDRLRRKLRQKLPNDWKEIDNLNL